MLAKEIDFEFGWFCNFWVPVTLTLDPGQGHTVVHLSSSTTCIPNFIKIEETFCGRTDVRTKIWHPKFGSRPKKVMWPWPRPFYGWFVIHQLGHDIGYLSIKLDNSHFIRSNDIIGGPKIKCGSHDLEHTHFKGDLSSICCDLVQPTLFKIWPLKLQQFLIYGLGVVTQQNLSGSRDLITPISGIIRYPWASNCNDQPVYQIWSLYLHPLQRYERRYKMSKMEWFEVDSGHSRSLEIAPFNTVYTSSY